METLKYMLAVITCGFLASCGTMERSDKPSNPINLCKLKRELQAATCLEFRTDVPRNVDFVYQLNSDGKCADIDLIVSCLDFSGKDGYEEYEEEYSYVLSFYNKKKLIRAC
jgi:hypothetical protein